MTTVVSAFNDHFMEMVDDIVNVFPDDLDILSARNSLKALRKINPKMLIRSWDFYVVSKYYKEIESGDLSYFLNKDYTEDVSVSSDSKRIIEAINRLRNPIKSMSEEEPNSVEPTFAV